MAIVTLDGALAGMQPPKDFVKSVTGTLVAGRPFNIMYLAGIPGAMAAPSTGLKGTKLSTYAGQLPWSNPVSGNSYLARLQAMATQAGTLMLCDRLWHNGSYGITTKGAQIIGNPIVSSSVANPTVITCTGNVPFANSDVVKIVGHTGSTPAINGEYTISNVSGATFTIPVNVSVGGGASGSVGMPLPARDANGATVGAEVQALVEVSSATGSASPALTMVYTNTLGTRGQSGVNITPTTTTSPAGTCYFMGLAAGDVGIQLVQSLGLSVSWLSGTISLVLYRVLARLELLAMIPNAIDALTGGFPRIFDDSVPFLLFLPNTTTTSNVYGHCIITQG